MTSLENILKEAREIVQGDRIPWEDLSDTSSEASSQDDREEPATELRQLVASMAEIITCLMRLSMAIRNPAPRDQFRGSAQIDMSCYEPFDIEHVRGKYPQAEEFLIIRLGRAISRRRQYLRYRDEHRKKLGRGLEEHALVDNTARTIAPSENIQSTVASSIPAAIKLSASTLDLDEEDYAEDTLSQTSYA